MSFLPGGETFYSLDDTFRACSDEWQCIDNAPNRPNVALHAGDDISRVRNIMNLGKSVSYP